MQLFTLTIQPKPNNEVVATIFQQPFPAKRHGIALPFKALESITGLPFVALQDEIREALRANHHKPAVLKSSQPIELSEASGIRLALLFKAIAPLRSVDAIQSMIRRIAAMSDEEVYYWFAKCYGEYADQATHALRILHGAEMVSVAEAVQEKSLSLCACGCGNPISSNAGKGRKARYFSGACRVRAHRAKSAL